MILTLTEVTQEFTKSGAEARKITGTKDDGSETTKWVFDNMKMAWPLLEEGNRVELKMVQKGQFWNITNVKLAEEEWPENTEEVAPEEVAEKPKPKPETKPEPAPQAVGMITNNLTLLLIEGMRSGAVSTFLQPLFGREASIELVKWYRGQVLAITRVSYDGAKLPQFGPKRQEHEVEPNDIQF